MLSLGFHYHVPARQDADGCIYLPGYLGRFIDSLAGHCASLTLFLHSPRTEEGAMLDYCIQAPNVYLMDIGPHRSVPHRMLFARRYTQSIRKASANLDIMLIRGPSPLLPAVAAAVGTVPLALLLVGDYRAGIENSPQPLWRRELIRIWSQWNYHQQLRVARRSLTFVNNRALFESLSHQVSKLVETRTTTLSNDDFFEREDTCLRRPVRLLYTGRMTRFKGLLDIVEAVAILAGQGEDVVLDLVGWVESGETIMDDIRVRAAQLQVEDRILFHGYKAVGEELFDYYKKADIYVLATQTDFEGFPRTLWEAMAHSLPLVVTQVGSLPHYLANGAAAVCTLIPPGKPDELAAAVQRLMHDADLRQRHIRGGRRLATTNTLEVRAVEMMTHIQEVVRNPQ